MAISFTVTVILLGSMIAQGIFAAALLGFARTNVIANRLLACLVLSFSVWLLDGLFQLGGVYQQDPNFYFLPIFYSLGLGPLLYLYVRSLTTTSATVGLRHAWHFIPVLLQASLYLFLTSKPYAYRSWFWFEVHAPFTYGLEFYLTVASLMVYGLASVRRIQRFQEWLRENYSEFSRIRLQWLKVVVGLLLVLCLLWCADVMLRESSRVFHWESANALFMGGIVLVLSVGGLRQQAMGNVDFVPPTETDTPTKITLDADLLNRIKEEMREQAFFRQPELTLKQFARELGLPPRQVSQYLNQGLEQSFVDFVNSHRVAYLQERLADGALDRFTLLAIALESGFNSKSSFNRAFKRFTGITPTAYLKAENLEG
ncbi:MAG: helix-turn-helix domain-containing protein [Bacteroidota bacterium]